MERKDSALYWLSQSTGLDWICHFLRKYSVSYLVMELHFLTVSTGLAPGGPGISCMQIFMSKSPPSRVWHDLTFIGVIGGFYGIKQKIDTDQPWPALTFHQIGNYLDRVVVRQIKEEADQGGGEEAE